jgi:phosphatidylserine decarboxylase
VDREKRVRGFPIAREGFIFILPSLFLSIIFLLMKFTILSILTGICFLFFLFFFRNPKRFSHAGHDIFISPADGKIIEIKKNATDEMLTGEYERISIFMSLASVHVNRAPCEGTISKVLHKKGAFALAFKKDIDKENERNYILIDHQGIKILIVQIAGFLARRITSYVKEKDSVKRGDPVGIIAFGSRVDIYIPKGYESMVSLNEKVKAGVTPLAKKRNP